MQFDNLTFRVEFWSRDGSRLEETRAACANLFAAQAAFREECERFPNQRIRLCERSRIISDRAGLSLSGK